MIANEVHDNEATRSRRVATKLSPSELERIDEWGFQRRIRERSSAIRELVLEGLSASKGQPMSQESAQ